MSDCSEKLFSRSLWDCPEQCQVCLLSLAANYIVFDAAKSLQSGLWVLGVQLLQVRLEQLLHVCVCVDMNSKANTNTCYHQGTLSHHAMTAQHGSSLLI